MSFPFDGMLVFYVLMFAATVAALSFLVPPVGARFTLGRVVDRYAHVPREELEDAIESEGKRLYLNWTGFAAVLLCGFIWRVLMEASYVVKRSLESGGMNPDLAFAWALFPAVLMPLIFKYVSRGLMVLRLDRKFPPAITP